MMRDLTEKISGMVEDRLVDAPYDEPGQTPPILVIPRTMGPEYQTEEDAVKFSGQSLTAAAAAVQQTLGTAATSVKGAAGSAADTVKGLWAKLTGKDSTPTINLPVVAVVGTKTAATDSGLTWLWVLLVAGGAYLVYHFTKGKGKSRGKSFFKPRASGSHVKSYGK